MTRKAHQRQAFGVALVLLLCGLPGGLHAEDPSCQQLEAERGKLVAIGVDKDMARGYEWARANLPQADLDLIREFIEISERLRFRCQTSAASAVKPDGEKVSAEQTNTSAAIPPLPVKRSSVIGN
jgi:hypothetical protein